MKYFLAFQKHKALPIPEGTANNESLAIQLNHELMKYGFILNSETIKKLGMCDVKTLDIIYNDLLEGIRTVVPGGGYEPIYKGFPQSVVQLADKDLLLRAMFNYYKGEDLDIKVVSKALAIDPVEYTSVGFMTEDKFNDIFYNIVYSNNSINDFDKSIVEYFLFRGTPVDMGKIVFKETLAYVGQKLMDSDLEELPTKNAIDILRIYSSYCNGDEGLKENTKFKNPSNKQRKLLLNSLDKCFNLEDAFKTHREKWLRVLYYLHPMTEKNRNKYPNVYKYSIALRNMPKELRTFNSKVEEAISNEDVGVFELLKKKMGVFSRRLDHLIRVFGITTALENWFTGKPNAKQLISVYNHLKTRTEERPRSAIIAGQTRSRLVNFKALEPLMEKDVKMGRDLCLRAIKNTLKGKYKKAFIHPVLYLTPLATNNRAANMSLSGNAIGKVEAIPAADHQKTIRLYCMWEGRSDIDLSATVLKADNTNIKVGWNGSHNHDGIVYSGDNTGRYAKNAEYIDIPLKRIPSDTDWVIVDIALYSGYDGFKDYPKPPMVGWMMRAKSEANDNWKPDTVQNAIAITSDTRSAYTVAFHIPTKKIVYLDIEVGNNHVSSPETVLRMRSYLNAFIANSEANEFEISWDVINQGHILNMLATEVVDKPEDADIVFDENTPQEIVAKEI